MKKVLLLIVVLLAGCIEEELPKTCLDRITVSNIPESVGEFTNTSITAIDTVVVGSKQLKVAGGIKMVYGSENKSINLLVIEFENKNEYLASKSLFNHEFETTKMDENTEFAEKLKLDSNFYVVYDKTLDSSGWTSYRDASKRVISVGFNGISIEKSEPLVEELLNYMCPTIEYK